MALSITVAGTERASYCQRFSWRRPINGVGSGTFQFRDTSATPWTPTAMDEIIVTVDGSTVFRGRILSLDVQWATAYTTALSTVQCADINDRANLELLNTPAYSGKLRSILTTIMGNLSAQNITLGTLPTAGEGVTLGDQLFQWVSCRDALDHLATLTGYVWRIAEDLTLEMWSVGAKTSGVTFNQGNANIRDVGWSQDVTGYRNIQWLVFGPAQTDVPVTDIWTNDGTNRYYALSYQLNGGLPPNVVTRSDTGVTVPCGPDTTWEWSYDSANNRIVQTGGTPVANGSTLTVTYTCGFPQYIVRSNSGEIAARGRWMKKDAMEEIVDVAAAQEYADALIRNNIARPVTMTLTTRVATVDPGETCTVDVPALGIASATFLAQSVSATYRPVKGGSAHVEFTLELVGGAEVQTTYQDFWSDLIKGTGTSGGGGSISGGTGAGGGSGSATPGAVFLGGSRSRSVQADPAGPPAGAPVPDYVPVTLDSTRYPSGFVTVRCEVMTRNAATSVTPKLVCLDTNAVVGTGTAVTSTSWSAVTFAATLVAGTKRYALYLVGSNGSNEVLGIGYLE